MPRHVPVRTALLDPASFGIKEGVITPLTAIDEIPIVEEELYQAVTEMATDGESWETSLKNETISKWRQYQASVVATIKQTPVVPLRVLLVSGVRNHAATVERFTNTVKTLRDNGSGDQFHFGFFHMDTETELWKAQEWYHEDFVVLRKAEHGCKLEFLIQISEKTSLQYEYIWFLDEDMDFTLFNWDLYRWLLVRLSIPISQPAYVSKSELSYPKSLGMRSMIKGANLVIAREVLMVEGGSAILRADLWPPMLDRIIRAKDAEDLLTDWGVDTAWSALGLVSKQYCHTAGNVVVFASPILHRNSLTNKGMNHDRDASGVSAKAGLNRCERHCGPLCKDWQATDMSKVEASMHCGALPDVNTTFKAKTFSVLAKKLDPSRYQSSFFGQFGEGFGRLELHSVESIMSDRRQSETTIDENTANEAEADTSHSGTWHSSTWHGGWRWSAQPASSEQSE
jgi:hypothetical protein